jgi:hypothetical protein
MIQETKCSSKICWELLELTEKQENIIQELTHRIIELESVLNEN